MTLPYCDGSEFRCLDSVECLQKERADLVRRYKANPSVELAASIADIDIELSKRAERVEESSWP